MSSTQPEPADERLRAQPDEPPLTADERLRADDAVQPDERLRADAQLDEPPLTADALTADERLRADDAVQDPDPKDNSVVLTRNDLEDFSAGVGPIKSQHDDRNFWRGPIDDPNFWRGPTETQQDDPNSERNDPVFNNEVDLLTFLEKDKSSTDQNDDRASAIKRASFECEQPKSKMRKTSDAVTVCASTSA